LITNQLLRQKSKRSRKTRVLSNYKYNFPSANSVWRSFASGGKEKWTVLPPVAPPPSFNPFLWLSFGHTLFVFTVQLESREPRFSRKRLFSGAPPTAIRPRATWCVGSAKSAPLRRLSVSEREENRRPPFCFAPAENFLCFDPEDKIHIFTIPFFLRGNF